MRRIILLLLLVVAAGGIGWWFVSPSELYRRNHKALAASISKAEEVSLYEGLPHQGYEEAELKEEMRKKNTIHLHDFPFYAEPLTLKEEDAKQLKDLFCDTESFSPYRGEKKCGGFHPDYCVEWRVGESIYRLLVCFGCGEVKCYGPNWTLHCDVEDSGRSTFKKVLLPYQKNWPKTKMSGWLLGR